MHANADGLTGPILDSPIPRDPSVSNGHHQEGTMEPDLYANDRAWIALLVLGCGIVVAMLVTMLLWH